jgi:glycine/D-amino acid oxidase-like deaminating enzyme
VRVVVVGAGINGVTAALELTRRGHEVVLLDPGPLPHPLAASTDISKAVRAAYGTDEHYTELAERSIRIWREWNVELGVELYHETGFLFMRRGQLKRGDFEWESFELLQRRADAVERISASELRERFPAWNAEAFSDGFFEREAGYVESGRVVAALVEKARRAGVQFLARKFAGLDEKNSNVEGVFLAAEIPVIRSEPDGSHDGSFSVRPRDPSASVEMTVAADAVVMATGAWTAFLLPFTKNFFRATAQPVFHLRPDRPELFAPERFPVFGADISSTGYYGFPLNREGVLKIANHGPGREMSPDSQERVVTREETERLREFLSWSFPALGEAEIVHSRICFYCDTFDGNFWIAPDPERRGLVIAAGDCGHGFKFAPVLGELIADAVEGKENGLLRKFRWRPEVDTAAHKEAARHTLSSRP